MKKIILVAILSVSLMHPAVSSANTQPYAENERVQAAYLQSLMQLLAQLQQQLAELQAQERVVPAQSKKTYSYDSGTEFKTRYRATKEFAVNTRREGEDTYIWDFKDGSTLAGNVGVVNEETYNAAVLGFSFMALGSSLSADEKTPVEIVKNNADGFTIFEMRSTDYKFGAIFALKEIEYNGESGAVVMTSNWGTEEALEEFQSSLPGLDTVESAHEEDLPYFEQRADAETFLEGLIAFTKYSEKHLLRKVE